MLKERIDDLVDILAEEFGKIENTFLIRNNQQLVKYQENPEKWLREQNAHRNQYKREIAIEVGKQLKQLNEKTAKVLMLAYKEVDKDIIEISGKEIVVNKMQNEVKAKVEELQKFNEQKLKEFANQTFKDYSHTVKVINNNAKATDDLFTAIKRQLPKGIQNGIKIAYKDKREINFKSYMEMAVRTAIQTETSARQITAGAMAGQIFYVCDYFADCAPDHADYQGKIYYNAEANIPDNVQKYIDQNNILSMQEVRDSEPYLTTRPNCRHNFHAVSTEDVMSGSSGLEIAEQEGFKFGNYKGSNYEALQEQRKNERQIRKYKTQLENQQQLAKETGVRNVPAENSAKAKIREWQQKQRELIANNKEVLNRQYERENAKVIVDDLGVKYRYKVVDGELVKK